jgi:hypothetical protein
VTGGTAAVTTADDLPEPYAAVSLICLTALAVTAVRRVFTRVERSERRLAAVERTLNEERSRRASLEAEYAGLVEDYNELIIEQAEQTGLTVYDGGQHDHGPRCRCGRRSPRPYLSLVEPETRQGSA